jgi:rubredoxin
MKQVPARCGYCGYLFPSGYGFDPGDTGIEASMKGWENAPVSTPCPMCGRRRGRVLTGEYEFAKDAMKLLSGPESTVKDLERLAAFLRDAQGSNTSADEIQERANKEAPEVSALVHRLLASRPARMKLAAWLSLLASIIIPLVLAYLSGNAEKSKPSQVFYNNYGYQYNTTIQAPAPSDGPTVGKVGRNDLCPCGSGKKFKKCHGDPAREGPEP